MFWLVKDPENALVGEGPKENILVGEGLKEKVLVGEGPKENVLVGEGPKENVLVGEGPKDKVLVPCTILIPQESNHHHVSNTIKYIIITSHSDESAKYNNLVVNKLHSSSDTDPK